MENKIYKIEVFIDDKRVAEVCMSGEIILNRRNIIAAIAEALVKAMETLAGLKEPNKLIEAMFLLSTGEFNVPESVELFRCAEAQIGELPNSSFKARVNITAISLKC